MPATEVITTAGRVLKARWAQSEITPVPFTPVRGFSWIAIGDGTWSDKNNPPPADIAATALTHEVARKKIERAAWLELDNVNGTVFWKGNLYKEVAGPTTIVGLFATFTAEEAGGVQICEEGVFAGDVVTTASPYALAGEVVTPGTLYWVRNRPIATKSLGDTITAVAIWEEK